MSNGQDKERCANCAHWGMRHQSTEMCSCARHGWIHLGNCDVWGKDTESGLWCYLWERRPVTGGPKHGQGYTRQGGEGG